MQSGFGCSIIKNAREASNECWNRLFDDVLALLIGVPGSYRFVHVVCGDTLMAGKAESMAGRIRYQAWMSQYPIDGETLEEMLHGQFECYNWCIFDSACPLDWHDQEDRLTERLRKERNERIELGLPYASGICAHLDR